MSHDTVRLCVMITPTLIHTHLEVRLKGNDLMRVGVGRFLMGKVGKCFLTWRAVAKVIREARVKTVNASRTQGGAGSV